MTLTAWTLSLALTLSVCGAGAAHAQAFDVRLHSQLLAAGPSKRLTRAERGQLVQDIRLCERRLLLGLHHDEAAADALRLRGRARAYQTLGVVTWGVSYAAAIITTGILGFGRLATSLGDGPSSELGRHRLANYHHWAEPLIPFVGPFIFAGHTLDPGLIALGLASGVLQILGASLLFYATLTKPDSPCEPRLSRGGLEFRF